MYAATTIVWSDTMVRLPREFYIPEGWTVECAVEGLYLTTPGGATRTLYPWHAIKRVEYRRFG